MGQNRNLLRHVINFGYTSVAYLFMFIVGGYYLDITFFHNKISIVIGIILGLASVLLSFIRLVIMCNDASGD